MGTRLTTLLANSRALRTRGHPKEVCEHCRDGMTTGRFTGAAPGPRGPGERSPYYNPGCVLLGCFLIGFALAPWIAPLAPALFPWLPGIPRPIP